jgi:hypothetical protein
MEAKDALAGTLGEQGGNWTLWKMWSNLVRNYVFNLRKMKINKKNALRLLEIFLNVLYTIPSRVYI